MTFGCIMRVVFDCIIIDEDLKYQFILPQSTLRAQSF